MQRLQVPSKRSYTMALSLCGVPLEPLRVGAMRPVTLAVQFVLLTICYFDLVEATPMLCEGAPASAEIEYVSYIFSLVAKY